MCGIAGIIAFTDTGRDLLDRIGAATSALAKRGPDFQGLYKNDNVALGHRRLSIIDTSEAANQPMTSSDGSCTIIFNGEFFNYRQHRDVLISNGHQFRTGSDTEVLLELYRREGPSCLEKVNGFFALAVHDAVNKKLFIARDRMGVKPFYFYQNADNFIFGSELKSLMAAGVPKVLNSQALSDYLHLNYIPGDQSIFKDVQKLPPGHFAEIDLARTAQGKLKTTAFYTIPDHYRRADRPITDLSIAVSGIRQSLDEAVQRRLVADVPLGAFLSGGIDSSIITGIASRHTNHLRTFSIGFSDEPHFDETRFARMVSERFSTDHTVFSLTSDDLYNNLFGSLDYLDEPFADSSALAVNILSMHTRKHVTVALSGDGADEMFGGYNKHRAEWILRNQKFMRSLLVPASALLTGFKGSRNSLISNRIRQLHRFAEGVGMGNLERYWRWCGFTDEDQVKALLLSPCPADVLLGHRRNLLNPLQEATDLNDVLYMDMHMVLPDDMLVKVDRMSMAHALEIRSPFLDYKVVDLAFSIPSHFKVDKSDQKKILKIAFADLLPAELLSRRKQGFEIPLLGWLRSGLSGTINELLLDRDFINDQGIFRYEEINRLHKQLHSPHPGDATARIWALLVFQYWWKKYFIGSSISNSF